MSYDVSGKVYEVFETNQISDTFKKREFILEVENPNLQFQRTDYLKFQLTQDRCDLIDAFSTGDMIKVSFNLRGNKWEKEGRVSYFTNLEAWRIERATATSEDPGQSAPFPNPSQQQQASNQPTESFQNSGGEDDLPF